ncbi:sensor histidine kinase [Roseomonas populi]|uniref:histidine kinase n=1 Tax=Roseomonas populi TaxID=3121582 RepID=A0ABT1X8K3_9PROT|nr:HAMP domain-containing sensor histidine kinase [Roseomonas pecuniae]MCR0984446.1 HAMP domain-containing histidine kinase [Roseomonas pecuniae]
MLAFRRPRLRTLLLLSNLVVLVLPITGFWALRLYESALVRQTETELRAQAAVLTGAWRAARGIAPESLSNGLNPRALETARRRGLDLAHDTVLPLAPDPRPGPPPAPEAAEAGARLLPVLRDTQAVTLAALRLLDAAGVVVASTGADTGLSLAGLEEVEAARAGHPLAVLRRREKIATEVPGGISRTAGLRVHLAMPVLDGDRVDAIVLLSRTPATVTQTVSRKVPEIAAVALLLLLLVAGLAALASRLITRPLDAVVRAARQVAAGGATVPGGRLPPVPRTAVREAAELSDAIARMTATLEGRATYVRGLAAHISHEFKTPLASMRGAAELLAEHGEAMSAGERARFAAAIEDGVARLDRLVSGLLALARADMAAAGGRAALRPLADAAAARHPALRIAVSGEAEAAIAPQAAATVLDSLLGNALAHAGPGTAVTITLGQEATTATMTVSDDGPGLSPANAARAFDPFFTTAREKGGTGLGLAIARSLVEGAGGRIELLPSDSGASFRIVLARAVPDGAGEHLS